MPNAMTTWRTRLRVLLLVLIPLMAGCSERAAPEGAQRFRLGDREYVAYPVEVAGRMTPDELQAAANEAGRPRWHDWVGVRRSWDQWLIPVGLVAQVIAFLASFIDARSGRDRTRLSVAGWIGGVASVTLLIYFVARTEPVGVLAMAVMSLIFLGQVTGRRVQSSRDDQSRGVSVRRRKKLDAMHPSDKSASADQEKDAENT